MILERAQDVSDATLGTTGIVVGVISYLELINQSLSVVLVVGSIVFLWWRFKTQRSRNRQRDEDRDERRDAARDPARDEERDRECDE